MATEVVVGTIEFVWVSMSLVSDPWSNSFCKLSRLLQSRFKGERVAKEVWYREKEERGNKRNESRVNAA